MSGDTIVIAHHPYEPQREDELQLAKGDRVIVTDSSDPDWWVGKKEDGTSGYFPSNFVEPAQSEEKTAEAEETNQEHEPEAAPPKPIGMARVMEDYAMQGPDELTLHRGGIVTLYERFDDGWLKGEINGKVGRFPAEFVEDIDMPGRPDLGLQSVEASKNKEDVAENAEPSKPAFKLAAYGVKQGGIGSVLAGGFPVLKKTGGIKKTEEEQPKPANELSQAAEKQPEAAPTMPSEKQPKAETEPTKYIAKAIVLHPYDAENEDELNLLRGEYVNVIDKNVDEGWWKGTTERGQTGVFPSNFVKEVEEETIASPPPVRSRKSIASTGSQQSFSSTSASRVSTGISQRAPPLPDKSSRPTSMATSSRPGSVHDQTISPSNEIPPPVPEIPQAPRTTSEVGERPPPLPETRPPPVPEPSTRPKSLHEKEPAEEVPSAVSNETTTKEAVATKEESVQFPQERLDNESTATAVATEQKHDEAENDVPLSPANSPPAIPGRPSIPSSRPSSESGNLASPPPPVPGRPPVTPSRKSSESADVASPPAVPGRPPSIPSRRSSESVDLASPSPATAAPSTEPIAEATETEQSSESKPVQEQAAEKKEEEEEEEEEEKAAIEESESQQVKEQEKETKGEQALEKDEIIAVGPEENLAKPEESSESTATKEVSEEAETEPKRQELEMQPSGPRLSAPSRARPARARRSPETRKEEPSQMEMLQQQLDQTPPEEPKKEEPKEEPTPPAKPIKPIFTKFPTPFAGGTPPELKNLKPVQRRMWEPAPAHEQETKKEEAEEPPRPTGVRNIASRFNMPSSGGSNEVLETKLKNFTKNEVEKSRKELERQLQEEREKRIQLEELVASLAEKVEQLQSRLEQ